MCTATICDARMQLKKAEARIAVLEGRLREAVLMLKGKSEDYGKRNEMWARGAAWGFMDAALNILKIFEGFVK